MANTRRHPPQLQLAFSTPPHQSFKRSFQQFGLDVDSPQSAGGSSSSDATPGNGFAASASSTAGDGNERNKRARSESSSVEYGETSGSSSAAEVERYRPMIPEFLEDTMEGIEVGSSESSSTSASGSTSANASTVNSSLGSSFESSLFSSQTVDEHRGPVVEPPGLPVAIQSSRRRHLDLPSFRLRSMQHDRPTLPAIDDVNRPSLHPALRARPSSPVMTVPTTHGTAARPGSSAPPATDPIRSLNAAIERARAFDASMEPLRHSPIDLPARPTSSSRMQQSGPRPRMRELHPDQLARFGGGADSDGEDVDLPSIYNEYSGRERLLSVGNPAIPTMPTSPDVELNAFSVGPLESASRPGPGTASSLLRSRLETASRHAGQGGPLSRRIPRLQIRDQFFGPQSAQAPALYPSSTWSQDALQDTRDSARSNSLQNHVNLLVGEMNSPVRLEEQQRLDIQVPHELTFERQFQPSQASGAEPIFRSDGTQRQMRRRPRTLLNTINRSSSPPHFMPSTTFEPAAALRRLLSNEGSSPHTEPRYDSIFAPSEIQRERVLPPPATNSGRASARPLSSTSEVDRERFARYNVELSGVNDRGVVRPHAPLHNPPEMRSSSRSMRRPGLLNPGREDAPERTLPDLFSVYDEGVEREADELARLSSTLPGIRTQGAQATPYSPTYEDDGMQWSRALRTDNRNVTSVDSLRRARPHPDSYTARAIEREMNRREERDVLPRPITALTTMREQDRMLGFESAATSPFETPNPWEQPHSARPMLPDFDFDTSSRSAVPRPVSDSFSLTHGTQTDSVLRERRLRLMTETGSSYMNRMAVSPQEDGFRQSWAESANSYDAEPSFSAPSTGSFSRNGDQTSVSYIIHRPPRLMGPRRSSGSGQTSNHVPRLPVNEQDYSGWLPAPRSPTRQVEVTPSELSSFYNDPSFDIPPSPPQEAPAWRRRMWNVDHFAVQEQADDSRPSVPSSQQYQPQNETVPGSRSDEYFANLLFSAHEESMQASSRDRERTQVHRLLARRNPLIPVARPATRREATPTAAPSTSHRGDVMVGQVTSNRFEATRQLLSERAPSTAPTSEPNTSLESRNLWGDVEGQDAEHTMSSWGQTLRRRQRASLNPPIPSIDTLSVGRRDARESNAATGFPLPATQSRLSSNTTNTVAARRQNARRPRLPSMQITRSPFTDEPLASLRTMATSRRAAQRRAARNFGDFVRDEDFDSSYEGLLALAATLGEVKPRSTPSHIIDALPTGTFKEWQKKDSDPRCPICLDDYTDSDAVLRCEPCGHWCHKECLQQWLHTARTCPVCRGKVHPPGCPPSPAIAGPSNSNSNNNNNSDDDSSDDEPSWGSPRIPSEMYRMLQSAYYR